MPALSTSPRFQRLHVRCSWVITVGGCVPSAVTPARITSLTVRTYPAPFMYAVFVCVNNGLFALFVETLIVLYTSDVSPCLCPGPWIRVLEYVLEFTMFNAWDTCFQLRQCEFFPRCMECGRGLAMRILSVRSSVCLSKAWIVKKTEEKSVRNFIPYERSFSLVF